MSWRLPAGFLLTFAVAACVLFGLSCGGSSDDDPGSSSSGPSSSSSPSSPQDSEQDEDSEEDEPADETVLDVLASLAKEEEADALQAGTHTGTGGTPYYGAAAAIRETLAANGVDVPDLDIYVLPIGNTGQSLLVLESNEAVSSTGNVPDDMTPALTALLDSEALSKANVTQFALNLLGSDEQGPVTITMTMSIESLRGVIAETLTEAEMETAIQYGVTRP